MTQNRGIHNNIVKHETCCCYQCTSPIYAFVSLKKEQTNGDNKLRIHLDQVATKAILGAHYACIKYN